MSSPVPTSSGWQPDPSTGMRAYKWAIAVTLLVIVGNPLGERFQLYENTLWYDVVMHALAGAGVSFLIAGYVETRGSSFVWRLRPRLTVILTLLIIGLLWEALEAFYDIAGEPVGSYAYLIDTCKDLADDCLGSYTACLIVWWPRRAHFTPVAQAVTAPSR